MFASRRLPPSERDFQVYRLLVIEGTTTYEAAEIFQISQTRVRQVQRRVIDWAAEVLPPEADREAANMLRVMQIAASERLEQAYAEAIDQWRQTSEPKFLNLVLRAIQTEVKLGLPARAGMLESLVEKLRGDLAPEDEDAGDPARPPEDDEQAACDDALASVPAAEAWAAPQDQTVSAADAAAEAAFKAEALAVARSFIARHSLEIPPSARDCSLPPPPPAGQAEPPPANHRLIRPKTSKMQALIADDPFWKAERQERIEALLKPAEPEDRS